MLSEHVLATFMSIAICQLLYVDNSDQLYPTVSIGTYTFSVLETNRTT